MPNKQKILAGRRGVEAYRQAHTALHNKPWHKGIPEEHTPLLNAMLEEFKKQGFNSIQEFFDASYELSIAETGICEHSVYKLRQDLEMLGEPIAGKGVELRETEFGRELIIDGQPAMSTSIQEHATMAASVAKCPPNATVFIGGLGIGLILLYLAESGRAMEVIVCEMDDRVISLLEAKVTDYLRLKYPEFSIKIIQGDALQEITKLGKFDWIFFDLTKQVPDTSIPSIESALTENGVYTDWWVISQSVLEGRWE